MIKVLNILDLEYDEMILLKEDFINSSLHVWDSLEAICIAKGIYPPSAEGEIDTIKIKVVP